MTTFFWQPPANEMTKDVKEKRTNKGAALVVEQIESTRSRNGNTAPKNNPWRRRATKPYITSLVSEMNLEKDRIISRRSR